MQARSPRAFSSMAAVPYIVLPGFTINASTGWLPLHDQHCAAGWLRSSCVWHLLLIACCAWCVDRHLNSRVFWFADWTVMHFVQVGTPRTHQKFLNREDGSYGPIPMRPPMGILNMPFNMTDVHRLYCAGDSTFPGQGVNAVVFSGFGAAHRAMVDQGKEKTWPAADKLFNAALSRLRYNT